MIPANTALPVLPNPGIAEGGFVACNEPLIINGITAGYCDIWVKPDWSGWIRRTPPRTHPGKAHRITWGTR